MRKLLSSLVAVAALSLLVVPAMAGNSGHDVAIDISDDVRLTVTGEVRIRFEWSDNLTDWSDEASLLGDGDDEFGFVPALVSPFLVRRVGEARAKDLLLTARFVDAREAKEMGLVNHVTEPDQLDAKVNEFAEMLSGNTPQSLQLTKDMFEQIGDLPLEAALDFAKEVNAMTRQTKEFKTGLAEILKKLSK